MFNIYGIVIWALQKPQKIEKKVPVKNPPQLKKIPPPSLHLLMLFGKPWYIYIYIYYIYLCVLFSQSKVKSYIPIDIGSIAVIQRWIWFKRKIFVSWSSILLMTAV